jgi:surfactin synthase thioesterase subunit
MQNFRIKSKNTLAWMIGLPWVSVSRFQFLLSVFFTLVLLEKSYVRADILSMERLAGVFEPTNPPQFTCPFVQFAGKYDAIIGPEASSSLRFAACFHLPSYVPVSHSQRDYTSGTFTLHTLEQGHFFDRDERFLTLLSAELDDINDYQV